MRMLAGLFCFLTWAWIKSWFVRKLQLPVYTELEIDDDDREMQKEFFPGSITMGKPTVYHKFEGGRVVEDVEATEANLRNCVRRE